MTTVAIVHGLLADFDYYGAAALVAAVGAIVSSVLAFLAQAKARTVASHVEEVKTAVTTSNGATLAELADATEARRVDQLPSLAGETQPPPAPKP